MKYLIVALLPVVIFFSSCSEDFKVAAPYKNITIVYGFLDVKDTAHYIRIQKAFLDENKSAITMAQTPDSSFYAQLNVVVKELSGGNVVNVQPLVRVDLSAEGYPKQPGAFFTAPNYAYKFKKNLVPGNRYRIVINNPSTSVVDSVETDVLSNDPNNDFTVPAFTNGQYNINFAPTSAPGTVDNFNLYGTAPANAAYVEGTIRFHYRDELVPGGTTTPYSFDWLFASAVPMGSNRSFQLSVPKSSFFTAIRNGIGLPSAANIYRDIDSVDVIVYAATQDAATYLAIQGAQGGLTGDQIKPNYTNIKGPDVLGLVASRTSVSDNKVPINKDAIDSLKVNPITIPIRIK